LELSGEPAHSILNSDSQIRAVTQAVSSRAPQVREARFSDHSQIVEVALKFDLYVGEYADWAHLWIDNPTYRELGGKCPIGWVLESADGRLAGYLGNVPLTYELNGQRLIAAATRSWVVDSSHRGYSLMLLSPYYQQSKVDLFLGTSVNIHSAVATDVFRNVRVPVGAWDRTLFWITHPQGFAESYCRKKGWVSAKFLAHAMSLGFSVYDRSRNGRFRKMAGQLPLDSAEAFDDRFDAFWAALREKKSGVLLGIRNRETLDWHFQIPLQKKNAWIYVLAGDRGLGGYAVFLRQDRRQVGLSCVSLADFQCLEQEKTAVFFLTAVHTALQRCREESIHMLELIGLPLALEKIAEQLSPYHRQLPNWTYFYRTNNPALAETLKSPDVWEPSLFDGDSSL
jgi:hypothetical protein